MLLALAMIISVVPMTAMAEEAHKCDFEAGVTSDGDGTHNINCSCGKFVKVNCLDNDGDGKCDSCGYVKYAHKCDFEAGVTSNGDGTHNINCSCGKFVKVNCLDNDGDGKCDSCGYVKYAHKCDFEAGVTSNGDGTHNINCSCGEFVKVNCLDNDGDGKCDSCGYVKYEAKPECEHNGLQYVKDNGDEKTHKVTCECGEVISEATAHTYDINGVCACGAIHICHYEAGVTSNNDGTHNINCTCGDYVQVGCLDNDGDGKCDSCGYVKYVAPEAPPEEAPAQSYNTAGLDNVPKTGNILIEWLYALIFG